MSSRCTFLIRRRGFRVREAASASALVEATTGRSQGIHTGQPARSVAMPVRKFEPPRAIIRSRKSPKRLSVSITELHEYEWLLTA